MVIHNYPPIIKIQLTKKSKSGPKNLQENLNILQEGGFFRDSLPTEFSQVSGNVNRVNDSNSPFLSNTPSLETVWVDLVGTEWANQVSFV